MASIVRLVMWMSIVCIVGVYVAPYSTDSGMFNDNCVIYYVIYEYLCAHCDFGFN